MGKYFGMVKGGKSGEMSSAAIVDRGYGSSLLRAATSAGRPVRLEASLRRHRQRADDFSALMRCRRSCCWCYSMPCDKVFACEGDRKIHVPDAHVLQTRELRGVTSARMATSCVGTG